jgi:NAD(P) transhydrogenase subunit alpha
MAAGHDDAAYSRVGASVGPDPFGVDLVTTIGPLGPAQLSPGTALLGMLAPFERGDEMFALAERNITVFAFEAIPRTTRAQMMDALSSQATVSGYEAVILAAGALDRFFPMLTTAAGTVRPASVLVLGAGVAGLQAMATARRLGAVVHGFDVRAAAEEQVRSLGARFISLDGHVQDASTSGGYAQELEADTQQRVLAGLAPHVASADVVIATAAVPGRPAPKLINKEMVESMRPGAVIVDVSATTGGNCELTVPGQVVEHKRVKIIGSVDLPSRVAGHASQMYARNVTAFIELITGDGGSFRLDLADDIIDAACVVSGGEVRHPSVRRSTVQA